MHLVQLTNSSKRRVALVQEPDLVLLRDVDSVLALATQAIQRQRDLSSCVTELLSGERLSYDHVYNGDLEWKLLAPVDVPGNTQRVLVSGTGLTHLGSARERAAMHAAPTAQQEAQMTDSMRMFEWGRQHGHPIADSIGVAPEWFYKGDGCVVQAPFAPLTIPGHAEDGGEEAEVAAIYLVGPDGTPWRVGMAVGNEFSDHVFEKRNYLNLAGSKLRMCSLGPELVIDGDFHDVKGAVRIMRDGEVLWRKEIRTGEENMCHSLSNLEHHHFKFDGHRQPGLVHIHFLGADALSFGDGVRLQTGDVAEVQFAGFGRALKNPIATQQPVTRPVRVQPMH
jgi:hypothetical protein